TGACAYLGGSNTGGSALSPALEAGGRPARAPPPAPRPPGLRGTRAASARRTPGRDLARRERAAGGLGQTDVWEGIADGEVGSHFASAPTGQDTPVPPSPQY